jgi:hypothetical protein
VIGGVSKLIGPANTLMCQGITALAIGLLYWRYLHNKSLHGKASFIILAYIIFSITMSQRLENGTASILSNPNC